MGCVLITGSAACYVVPAYPQLSTCQLYFRVSSETISNFMAKVSQKINSAGGQIQVSGNYMLEHALPKLLIYIDSDSMLMRLIRDLG